MAYQAGPGTANTLFVTDTAGGDARAIASGCAHMISAQWSPAGDAIAFDGGPQDRSGVALTHPDGSGRTSVIPVGDPAATSVDPTSICCAAWSPDGRKLLFQGGQGGRSVDLFTMNVDGSGLIRLTDHPGDYAWYAWGPAPAR